MVIILDVLVMLLNKQISIYFSLFEIHNNLME